VLGTNQVAVTSAIFIAGLTLSTCDPTALALLKVGTIVVVDDTIETRVAGVIGKASLFFSPRW
jgi:hypothetical protein